MMRVLSGDVTKEARPVMGDRRTRGCSADSSAHTPPAVQTATKTVKTAACSA
jgi:hypothetical protein